MISEKMQKAINAQIQKEFNSSFLYLAMAAWAEEQNLPGFGHWLRLQAQEENNHAMKFFEFMLDRGGHVKLYGLEEQPDKWESLEAAFEDVLAHEQMISRSINDLYKLAVEENDYPAQVLLQWFITEQVEEEKSAEEVLINIRRAGESQAAIFMLDQMLGQRVPEAPAAE
jgi:ferritin